MFFRLLLLFSLSLSIRATVCNDGYFMEGYGAYHIGSNGVENRPGIKSSVVCAGQGPFLCSVTYHYEREENGGREFQKTEFGCHKSKPDDVAKAISSCNRHSINRNSKLSPSKDSSALTYKDANMINIGLEYVETGECYCNLDNCNDPFGTTASVFSLLILVFPFIYHFLE